MVDSEIINALIHEIVVKHSLCPRLSSKNFRKKSMTSEDTWILTDQRKNEWLIKLMISMLQKKRRLSFTT